MAKMQEVYGFSVDPDDVPGPYVAFTVDHLFGEVWCRPGLGHPRPPAADHRRAGRPGQDPLLEIQFSSAWPTDELTEDQVREIVVHLTHYIGWPLSPG
jgi:4-carboxymuconolactone decarboxylase